MLALSTRMRVGALTTKPFSTARQASCPTAGKEMDRSPSHHIYHTHRHARYPALIQQGQHQHMIQAALNKRASQAPIRSGQARKPSSSSLRSSTRDHCRHGLLLGTDGFGQAQLKAYWYRQCSGWLTEGKRSLSIGAGVSSHPPLTIPAAGTLLHDYTLSSLGTCPTHLIFSIGLERWLSHTRRHASTSNGKLSQH